MRSVIFLFCIFLAQPGFSSSRYDGLSDYQPTFTTLYNSTAVFLEWDELLFPRSFLTYQFAQSSKLPSSFDDSMLFEPDQSLKPIMALLAEQIEMLLDYLWVDLRVSAYVVSDSTRGWLDVSMSALLQTKHIQPENSQPDQGWVAPPWQGVVYSAEEIHQDEASLFPVYDQEVLGFSYLSYSKFAMDQGLIKTLAVDPKDKTNLGCQGINSQHKPFSCTQLQAPNLSFAIQRFMTLADPFRREKFPLSFLLPVQKLELQAEVIHYFDQLKFQLRDLLVDMKREFHPPSKPDLFKSQYPGYTLTFPFLNDNADKTKS